MTLTVNGRPQPVTAPRGSYVTIDREWKSGDRVDVRLPMTLRTEAMADNPEMIAIMYGPLVLAGDLGRDGLDSIRRYGPSAPPVGRVKTPAIPSFVGDVAAVTKKITADPTRALQFRTVGLAQPHDITLVPFYRIVDQRYTVYWNVYSPEEWKARVAAAAAVDARRTDVERRTIDRVVVDDTAGEQAHAPKGENATEGFFEGRRTREARGGWFSYELKIAGDAPVTLAATYRGSKGWRRVFDVLVDDQKIATESLEYHPTAELDKEYRVPEAITRGKDRLTVKFQPQGDTTAGALLEVKRSAESRQVPGPVAISAK